MAQKPEGNKPPTIEEKAREAMRRWINDRIIGSMYWVSAMVGIWMMGLLFNMISRNDSIRIIVTLTGIFLTIGIINYASGKK
jgi:hypothetical protein